MWGYGHLEVVLTGNHGNPHCPPPPQASRQVQTDYEKRLKEVESQREQLLNEMEARENTLISKVRQIGIHTCTW